MRANPKYTSVHYCLKKCLSLCTILTIVVIIMAMFMFIATCNMNHPGKIQIIYIHKNAPSRFTTHKKFLSIGLDSIVVAEGFKNFNMTDDRLITRIRYLSPGFIRLGGNLADKLQFEPNSSNIDVYVRDFYNKNSFIDAFNLSAAPNYTMTGSQWLQFNKFAESIDMDVFFDLNALIRFKNGSWDYENAESLIRFSHDHNITVNWELGNEPNSFKHKFNEVVNASQLAKDFITLRSILNKYPEYKESLLVGPDVTRPEDKHKESEIFLKEFLKIGGSTVNAITWHQYYLNGHIATAADFINPETFDVLKTQIQTVKDIVNEFNITKPLWLGETSSAYGGGAPDLSDRFISSFLWIDKLGLAAKMGIEVVIRQSIFRGYYALLDDNYDPNPDWWISIIYKNLVDKQTVPYYTATSNKTRFYVHCTKRSFSTFSPSATIFGINLDDKVANIRIEGLHSFYLNSIKSKIKAYKFELTFDKSITSKVVKLNGKLLKLLPDGTLPPIIPSVVYAEPFIKMSPFSIVFWVIPNTYIAACVY